MILITNPTNLSSVCAQIEVATDGFIVTMDITDNTVILTYGSTKKKKTIEIKLEGFGNSQKIACVKKLIQICNCYVNLNKIVAGDAVMDIVLMCLMDISSLDKDI